MQPTTPGHPVFSRKAWAVSRCSSAVGHLMNRCMMTGMIRALQTAITQLCKILLQIPKRSATLRKVSRMPQNHTVASILSRSTVRTEHMAQELEREEVYWGNVDDAIFSSSTIRNTFKILICQLCGASNDVGLNNCNPFGRL